MYEELNQLRHVEIENKYRLKTWDTGKVDSMGKYIVGYSFTRVSDGVVIFTGEDFHCSPCHAIDSNEVLRSILGFLTLRPGDTDAEYFSEYNRVQMDFAENEAEYLQAWAMDDEEVLDYYNFIEIDE